MERCFGDKSALLKHEVAYCLGQLGDARAVAKLIAVLADADNQEPIVRHEAGEALGAIGSPDASVMAALRSGCSDAVPEVADTCRLAVARIEYFSSDECKAEELSANPYNSTDPAPPFPAKETSVSALKGIMLDSGESLFRRYRYGIGTLFCEIPGHGTRISFSIRLYFAGRFSASGTLGRRRACWLWQRALDARTTHCSDTRSPTSWGRYRAGWFKFMDI